MNQYTTALLKKIEDHGLEPELYEILAGTFTDQMRVQELSDLVYKHAQKMPFDMVLDFWEALEFPVEDIEEGCKLQGFVAWYEKTHGKTVQEVTK